MKLERDIQHHIEDAALAASLPISIVRGIVCQESAGKPKATRYEPAFFRRYVLPISGLTPEEAKGRATSWGLMQVMGQTARELGFKGKFEELLDPAVGLYWGCRYLNKQKSRYYERHGWSGVLAAYNGGSPRVREDGKFVNQYYVTKVLEYAHEVWLVNEEV